MRTYGLGSNMGGGLVGVGAQQKAGAMDILGKAAEQESERNIFNKQQKAQAKANNAQTGATLGATAGMVAFGPVGALVGGLAGGILGGLM